MMKLHRWRSLVLLLFCLGLMSFGTMAVKAAVIPAGGQGVTKEQLTVRKTNSASGTWLGTIPQGMTVLVRKVMSNGWYYINYNGRLGFVNGKYVCTLEEAAKEKLVTVRQAAAGLNLRQSASGRSRILRVVRDGEQLVLLAQDKENAYCKVSVMGRVGYVLSGYFTTDVTVKQTTRKLNFRQQPSKTAEPVSGVTTVPKGAKVTCFKYSGGWWQVKYKNRLGYVIGGSFREPMVTTDNVWVRETAKEDGEKVVAIPKGKTVTAYSYTPGSTWCLVAYAGNKGYVMSEFLKKPE